MNRVRAVPPSLIAAFTRHLADTDLVDERRVPGLLDVLAQVPDPRSRLGRRFAQPTLIVLALVTVLGGARSFAAITQKAAQLPDQVLDAAARMPPGARTLAISGPATARSNQCVALPASTASTHASGSGIASAWARRSSPSSCFANVEVESALRTITG